MKWPDLFWSIYKKVNYFDKWADILMQHIITHLMAAGSMYSSEAAKTLEDMWQAPNNSIKEAIETLDAAILFLKHDGPEVSAERIEEYKEFVPDIVASLMKLKKKNKKGLIVYMLKHA